MRVADAIVDILKSEGVKFVAALPGDDILPLFDAFHQQDDIPLILTRHEQATVFMADGYARSCGEPGVAMVTKGPGRCNAMTAIVNAFTDCVPLVVIFGHSSRKQLAKGMLQEVPYLDTFQTVAKWTFSIPSPERVPEVFRRAFTLARSGRPGPVIIEVPQDISMAQAEIPPYTKTRRVRFGPDPYDIDKLLELMRESKRPLIYVGRGALWSGATEDLVRVAEAFALPVMATLPAKGAMPEDHPLCLGLGGYPRAVYSTGQSKKFAEDADLVIALGCSFRQHATSSWLPKPAHAKLVQVDIDPAELHKNYAADLVMLSDLKLFLQALLQHGTQTLAGWRKGMIGVVAEEISELKKQWMDSWNPRLTSDEIPINPYRACWDLTNGLDRRKSILLHDAGVTRAYVSHHYEALFPNGFIGFGGTSAMGWSTPAAMGAKLAHPDKTVLNITGDGSFGLTGMEIETAARNDIRTLTVILNNQSLGASRETLHERFKGHEIGISLRGDYAAVARALGAYGERVEQPHDLRPALGRALAHPGPALLEVGVKPLEPRPWK
ncbi:MAG TPA: thiamine pyrophosphate-binding protein [Candidatus Binatia bacterium]|jgi:thiamine pyrophosphate-dependent acetolactate synthase large subunit-like protein